MRLTKILNNTIRKVQSGLSKWIKKLHMTMVLVTWIALLTYCLSISSDGGYDGVVVRVGEAVREDNCAFCTAGYSHSLLYSCGMCVCIAHTFMPPSPLGTTALLYFSLLLYSVQYFDCIVGFYS